MAYNPPTITSSGLSLSQYNDILNYLVQAYLNIYGPSCYLGADSLDFQDIATRALQAYDYQNALQIVMGALNPLTAIGTSLDLVGELIGTARKPAGFSSAQVTLTGTNGTVVTNGVVQDVSGNLWSLPSSVTIVTGGTTVTATAQAQGAITAAAGVISNIATPTSGWTAVTNANAATAGSEAEADSSYRARLLVAQALPSLSLLGGTAASLAALDFVTRSQVFENYQSPIATTGTTSGASVSLTVASVFGLRSGMSITGTNIPSGTYISSISGLTVTMSQASTGSVSGAVIFGSTDSAGRPANSLTCVVETSEMPAGTPTSAELTTIAQTIYSNKGIGCYTAWPVLTPAAGQISETVASPTGANGGLTQTINFGLLQYTPIVVVVKITRLTGWSTALGVQIQAAISDYLNSLGIGQSILYSELYYAAVSVQPLQTAPAFAITGMTIYTPIGSSPFLYAATGTGGSSALVVASNPQTTRTASAAAGSSVLTTTTSTTGLSLGDYVCDGTWPANVNIAPQTFITGLGSNTVQLSNQIYGAITSETITFSPFGPGQFVSDVPYLQPPVAIAGAGNGSAGQFTGTFVSSLTGSTTLNLNQPLLTSVTQAVFYSPVATNLSLSLPYNFTALGNPYNVTLILT